MLKRTEQCLIPSNSDGAAGKWTWRETGRQAPEQSDRSRRSRAPQLPAVVQPEVRRRVAGDMFGNPFVVVFVPDRGRVFLIQLEAAGDQRTVEGCMSDFESMRTSFTRTS